MKISIKTIAPMLLCMFFFSTCKKESNSSISNSNNTSSTNGSITGTITISSISYTTVKIGSQTWTSVNYNGSGGTEYPNNTNDSKYGKLYTIAESRAIALPSGWHLPKESDFVTLIRNYDNSYPLISSIPSSTHTVEFMAKDGWLTNTGIVPGTNTSGFNAYPAGSMFNGGKYDKRGYRAMFWVDNFYDNSYSIGYDANGKFVFARTDNSITIVGQPQPERQSVRFVKND